MEKPKIYAVILVSEMTNTVSVPLKVSQTMKMLKTSPDISVKNST